MTRPFKQYDVPLTSKQVRLIMNNYKMVYKAFNDVTHGYDMTNHREDLIQCGLIGLCYAARNWEPKKAVFSTFATICIRSYMEAESKRIVSFSIPDDVESEYQHHMKHFTGSSNRYEVEIIRDILPLIRYEYAQVVTMVLAGYQRADIAEFLGVVYGTAKAIESLAIKDIRRIYNDPSRI